MRRFLIGPSSPVVFKLLNCYSENLLPAAWDRARGGYAHARQAAVALPGSRGLRASPQTRAQVRDLGVVCTPSAWRRLSYLGRAGPAGAFSSARVCTHDSCYRVSCIHTHRCPHQLCGGSPRAPSSEGEGKGFIPIWDTW